jgi:hypothetical protein
MRGFGLDLFGSKMGPVTGMCEHRMNSWLPTRHGNC